MDKKDFQEALKKWVFSNRNYRSYSLNRNVVEKVWNRGMGSVDFIRFDLKNKTVCICPFLTFCKSDERKLKEFMRDNHMENWKVIHTTEHFFYGSIPMSQMCR